jgi:hypothetical protein
MRSIGIREVDDERLELQRSALFQRFAHFINLLFLVAACLRFGFHQSLRDEKPRDKAAAGAGHQCDHYRHQDPTHGGRAFRRGRVHFRVFVGGFVNFGHSLPPSKRRNNARLVPQGSDRVGYVRSRT